MTKKPKKPNPPSGTGRSGRRLWRSIVAVYELNEHELALLRQAARTADVVDDLQAVVDREGALTTTRLGETKAHPALVELRQQRLVLARLLAALRLPVDDPASGQRTQSRPLRGIYGIAGRR